MYDSCPDKPASGGDEQVDVAIVGAGQAGLATGKALAGTGLSLVLLDQAGRIGDSWRNRYDSLRLFSPRSLSALPGLALPGRSDAYPDKDEIADYLEAYARLSGLPVRLGHKVTSLRHAHGLFRLETDAGTRLRARSVVIATGAFQLSVIPPFARDLSTDVLQLDASTYRRPGQVPEGRTLVVGAGATGRQIARELARTHETWLACGRRVYISPHRLLGRDAMWWAKVTGLLMADKATLRGRLARRYDSFPGLDLTDRSLKRARVRIVGRAQAASGARIGFSCGRDAEFRTVVWAMGYRDDTSWIEIDAALDDRGVIEDRGISPVPGLFFAGRSWQTCRASALLCGAWPEAKVLAERVRAYLTTVVPDDLRGASARSGERPQRSTPLR